MFATRFLLRKVGPPRPPRPPAQILAQISSLRKAYAKLPDIEPWHSEDKIVSLLIERGEIQQEISNLEAKLDPQKAAKLAAEKAEWDSKDPEELSETTRLNVIEMLKDRAEFWMDMSLPIENYPYEDQKGEEMSNKNKKDEKREKKKAEGESARNQHSELSSIRKQIEGLQNQLSDITPDDDAEQWRGGEELCDRQFRLVDMIDELKKKEKHAKAREKTKADKGRSADCKGKAVNKPVDLEEKDEGQKK